jgi:glycyl-tRNA synthetase (class II)
MPRIYRSAQGQLINFDALILMNEKAQAVGNMQVNANGDDIGPDGKIIKTREQKMKEYYNANQQQNVTHYKGKK